MYDTEGTLNANTQIDHFERYHNGPCLPPKVCISVHCLRFLWEVCNTQEKLETKGMEFFFFFFFGGGGELNKVHYVSVKIINDVTTSTLTPNRTIPHNHAFYRQKIPYIQKTIIFCRYK